MNLLNKIKQNKLTSIMLFLFSILFIYLFVECFVFSSSFECTVFKSIDDTAFNEAMNSFQYYLKRIHLSKLLNFNEYAYGWIFWAINGIATFPFYLIKSEPLTIAGARILELLFSFGTLYLLYKIAGNYTKNAFYKWAVIIPTALSEFFITYAISFDTTSMMRFFGVLSVYFILKNKELTNKNIIFSAISLAAVAGVKLTGIFFMPIVGFLALNKIEYKLNKENLKKIGIYFLVFIPCFILFTNPGLFLFFVYKEKVKAFFELYGYFLFEYSKRNIGLVAENSSVWNLIYKGCIERFYLLIPTCVFLILAFCQSINGIKRKKYDFLIIHAFTLLAILYFALTIKIGAIYIAKYTGVMIIFLPLSLIYFEKFKKTGMILTSLILIFLLSSSFFNKYTPDILPSKKTITSNAFNKEFVKNKLYKEIGYFDLYNDLKKIITKKENETTFIISDYRIPCIFGKRKDICRILTFDNFSQLKDMINFTADYILIHKNTPAFSDDDEIKKTYKNSEEILADKKLYKEIIKTKKFKNVQYEKIYDKYNVSVYKKKGF